ncbi:hypothetical protein BCV70DRAFT_159578 [Testicularia cyperi]|uniref:Sensitive to high expression protein 9, mitochondrial n=1 Tax=Testicularia cyperi TaxID=1882483 RepID=A0A317XTE8_9BASI|nr:hypothetical protein BCV70DRAFT_159578 [Testicularia cyperi]
MESSTSALSSVRSRISDLSSQWNTYSGYTAVEELKARITLLEDELDQVRQTAAEAKREYLSSVSTRSAQQKELNDLLARKNVWTEDDLSRYTQLLRLEHQLNKAESEAEQNLDSKEKLVQDTFDNLMKTVLLRYHEEQTWSDRVRTLSTWGSFAVAGLNAFLFILAILLVEPYKRKRLAQTFETRLIKGEEQSRALILSSISEFEAKLDSALGGTNIYTNTGTGSETVASASTSPSTWEASSPATEQLDTQTPQIAFSDSEFFETSVSAEQTADPETLPTTPTPTQPQPTLLAPPTSKREEERLVFASTVGVVVGAALSILIGACLGS